jgi:hypothetical protein
MAVILKNLPNPMNFILFDVYCYYILEQTFMQIALTISCMVYFTSATYAENNPLVASGDTIIQSVSSSENKKKKKGDTLVYYEVLQLKDLNYSNKIMVVYVQSIVETRRSSATLHAKYLLKRERQYLSKIFFTSVSVLESNRTDKELLQSFSDLSNRYKGISLWTILNANQFFNKTHPH